MFKPKLFGANIEPSCSYCEHGNFTSDHLAVLCEKHGVVSPSYFCRKFIYDPLARIPMPPLKLNTQNYDKSDFEL